MRGLGKFYGETTKMHQSPSTRDKKITSLLRDYCHCNCSKVMFHLKSTNVFFLGDKCPFVNQVFPYLCSAWLFTLVRKIRFPGV